MKRRNFILGLLAVLAAGGAASWPVYRSFGKPPEQPIISPNWRHGYFCNLPNTYIYPNLDKEPDNPGGWLKFFFARDSDRYPPEAVVHERADLKSLQNGEFVWLGHSSLIFRLADKIVCIDPVLSSHASPLPFIIPAWAGSRPYTASDFPVIDYLCITHDHWDHLDYSAVNSLKFRHILCSKGVGSHFAYWHIAAPIHELDWFDEYDDGRLKFIFTPSNHFSGRSLTRNKTLWGGFIIKSPSGGNIYHTGDGGYGAHFGQIGKEYGPFDMVFPDSGQYNRAWPTVHMFPELAAAACIDAGAKIACPIHIGKFTLAWHAWNEPARRFTSAAEKLNLPYILPIIGQKRTFAGA